MTMVLIDAEGVDQGAPWHYGDPLREQRTLDEGRGFVDLSHHPVVRVSGPDRLTWLHSITSQHLTELPTNTWIQALVLSPNGHVEHHLTLVDDGEAVWAVVEPGTADALVGYLQRMKFWSDVDIADVTDQYAVMWRPGARGTSSNRSSPPMPCAPGRHITAYWSVTSAMSTSDQNFIRCR